MKAHNKMTNPAFIAIMELAVPLYLRSLISSISILRLQNKRPDLDQFLKIKQKKAQQFKESLGIC